jgi:hypothetical protein
LRCCNRLFSMSFQTFYRTFLLTGLSVICLCFNQMGCSASATDIQARIQLSWSPEDLRPNHVNELTVTWDTAVEFCEPHDREILSIHLENTKGHIVWKANIRPVPDMNKWKPGCRYRHTEPLFIPGDVPAGSYTVSVGLMNPEGKPTRLIPQAREHERFQLHTIRVKQPLPLSDLSEWPVNKGVGCHADEIDPDRHHAFFWISETALMTFPNPYGNSRLYIECACPLPFDSADLELSIHSVCLDRFPIDDIPSRRVYMLPAAFLGPAPTVRMELKASRSLVPADHKLGDDTRVLGAKLYYIRILPE